MLESLDTDSLDTPPNKETVQELRDLLQRMRSSVSHQMAYLPSACESMPLHNLCASALIATTLFVLAFFLS